MKTPPAPPTADINQILGQSTSVLCFRCQNATFQEVTLFRHVSAIVSPTGKEGNVPIPTFSCVACGWVNDEFLPPVLRAKRTDTSTAPSPDAPKKPSLILEK